MDYIQAENYIHSFTRFGSQLGLERMRRLLQLMGNPQKELKYIHIAGTNGKGSTAMMCTNILENSGYKVGTYISPFVVDFRERFQINSKMIEKEDFAVLATYIKPIVDKMRDEENMQVTEFEAVTAIAFKYFAENKCDIVCLEVGLGGRFDATNVIDCPLVAIIASISLDHTAILGDTIPKIAFEKAGIIKPNSTVITYPLQDDEAVPVLKERCREENATFILPDKNLVKVDRCDFTGADFSFEDNNYSIKLVGNHQIYNAVAVIKAMNILADKGFKISYTNIKQALSQTVFTARFEVMHLNPYIIVDGAHNKEAAISLGKNIDMLPCKNKVAIMGMMADKDFETAVKEVGSRCSAVITVPVFNNPRAVDNTVLAECAKKYCANSFAINDYDKALQTALSLVDENAAIIVCGSFYMASEIRKNILNIQ
ncbi:MAG: folylpolyglutamate synthase/dihydrofolate synthase family protein [Oscillospiraceae bacterium]